MNYDKEAFAFMMTYYEQQRTLHRQELREREDHVKQVAPAYFDLKAQIARQAADAARHNIRAGKGGKSCDIGILKATLSDLNQKQRQALSDASLPQNYLEMTYTCPSCQDTGFLPDGSPCHCLKQGIVKELYRRSPLTDILKRENFDTFDISLFRNDDYHKTGISARDNMTYILKEVKTRIDRIDEEPLNLCFSGYTGCGKSFLAHCIAAELMNRMHSVLMISAGTYFNRMADLVYHRSWGEKLDEDALVQTDCDLLILDDLGTETLNTFTVSHLLNCVNERLERGLSTLITTNLDLRDIKECYTERFYSRLIGNYKLYHFFGDDLRKTAPKKG